VNVPPVPRRRPEQAPALDPYSLQEKDIDRFLEKFDEYEREKKMAGSNR
jgi:hypothetical protein